MRFPREEPVVTLDVVQVNTIYQNEKCMQNEISIQADNSN
jgi:hypothetical protein